jgi:hypothetical protein
VSTPDLKFVEAPLMLSDMAGPIWFSLHMEDAEVRRRASPTP